MTKELSVHGQHRLVGSSDPIDAEPIDTEDPFTLCANHPFPKLRCSH